MLNLLVTAAAGADFVLQALGVLDSFASISYEKFMLDEELFSVVLRLLKGFNLEEGRAGPDLIREGIEAGHFLMAESTCRYLREELWIPRYRSRSREGLADELRQAWESRLQDWACQPLDEDCHEALLAYYRSRYGTTPEWFATGGPRSEGSK
ncbi:MAG: trimethylamine methyltransferase family protein [Bacillota bacterium]